MRRKNKKRNNFLMIVVLLSLLAGAGYVYTAPEFERLKPEISGAESIYWNRSDPLELALHDNISLKDYKVFLSDGQKKMIVSQGTFAVPTKDKIILIEYPKNNELNNKAKHLQLRVEVADKSFWNFFQGNTSIKDIKIKVDYKRPNVNVLSNSYSVTQGGSALVVFQADDINLEQLYIQIPNKKFQVTPYKKSGYYVALIAWPFREDTFHAKIVAIDKANNKRVVDIPFYVKNHRYRVSWIRARDNFIEGKITDLASSEPEYSAISDKLEKLKAINETMRLKNEELIHELSHKSSTEVLNKWKIHKFYPLKNGAKVASYGDERHYYYNSKENEVSKSYHVGYDLASTKMASIVSSNAGTVIYANENGIYGNMPIIDHGLGLYSLYGHCSQILVKEGDKVKSGQVIARTGVSGLALGDHLHFGLLVQGIEVRPIEWFDASWIRKNIDNVFHEADKIILDK